VATILAMKDKKDEMRAKIRQAELSVHTG
jgi:hypothetical protein